MGATLHRMIKERLINKVINRELCRVREQASKYQGRIIHTEFNKGTKVLGLKGEYKQNEWQGGCFAKQSE